MSKTVELPASSPGFTPATPEGSATFREKLNARQRNLIEAVGVAAAGAFSKVPDALQPSPPLGPDAPEEEKAARQEEEAARQEALAKVVLTRNDAEAMIAIREATVVAYLESWTLPLPLPTMETIGDLDPGVYDAVVKAAQDMPKALIDFSVSPDPGSPTGASTSNSDKPSTGDQSEAWTPKSDGAGVLTSTESSSPE